MENCKWHGMWPRFNRLYKDRFVNTTNLVEKLLHFMKSTLLDKKSQLTMGSTNLDTHRYVIDFKILIIHKLFIQIITYIYNIGFNNIIFCINFYCL